MQELCLRWSIFRGPINVISAFTLQISSINVIITWSEFATCHTSLGSLVYMVRIFLAYFWYFDICTSQGKRHVQCLTLVIFCSSQWIEKEQLKIDYVWSRFSFLLCCRKYFQSLFRHAEYILTNSKKFDWSHFVDISWRDSPLPLWISLNKFVVLRPGCYLYDLSTCHAPSKTFFLFTSRICASKTLAPVCFSWSMKSSLRNQLCCAWLSFRFCVAFVKPTNPTAEYRRLFLLFSWYWVFTFKLRWAAIVSET